MLQKANGIANLKEGRVFYEGAGEGVPLVFLHAVPFDRRMWDAQWRYFSQRYPTMRFDLLGYGRSDPLNRPISRRQELYGLLEAASVKHAILVGCSLSGQTILDVALERPDLVSGLVVVSATPGGFEMQGEPPQELMEMMAALEQGDVAMATELATRIWMDGPFRRTEQVDPLVRRRAAEMNRAALERGSWALTFATAPDPLDPPAMQRLDQIKAPVLLIVGEMDHPEILRAAGVMAEKIPDAKKVTVPGAAHLLNMEKPAEFNRAVEDFLRGIRSISGGN